MLRTSSMEIRLMSAPVMVTKANRRLSKQVSERQLNLHHVIRRVGRRQARGKHHGLTEAAGLPLSHATNQIHPPRADQNGKIPPKHLLHHSEVIPPNSCY